jgi:thiamine biosynthesis lipoprotein ApbE
MATRFELVLHGDACVRLRAAGEEAIEEIRRLDRQLSRFDPESDVSWINARAWLEPVRVEPRLFRLIRRAVEITNGTGGAFDITVAPLMRAWGLAGEGRVPSRSEMDRVRTVVGMHHVHLDEQSFTVSFDTPGVEIDLGAIGKGYAIECAVEVLRDNGVASALIHGGTSTVYALGAPPGGDGWTVAIAGSQIRGDVDRRITDPGRWVRDNISRTNEERWVRDNMSRTNGERWVRDNVSRTNEERWVRDNMSRTNGGPTACPGPTKSVILRDLSLSVSAPHGRFFEHDGRRYGHVIDPRTGEPVEGALLAAVVGPSPTETDALSTALLVLGEPWLPDLERRFPGYEGHVVPTERVT